MMARLFKSFLHYILFAFILSLGGCQYLISPEIMFKLHVLDPIPDTIRHIKYYKDNAAMHGPLFFRFETKDAEAIRMIIEKNHLKPVKYVLLIIDHMNDIASERISWWKPAKELNTMEKFCLFSPGFMRSRDWYGKCLFVGDRYQYFITTGFSPNEKALPAR